MSSFVSAKGPSIRVRFPLEYLMRHPFVLGVSPEASSSAPAFFSSSWYVAISAMSDSSGMTPASESLEAFTMIMNRMVVSPSGFSHAVGFYRYDERRPSESTRRVDFPGCPPRGPQGRFPGGPRDAERASWGHKPDGLSEHPRGRRVPSCAMARLRGGNPPPEGRSIFSHPTSKARE